MSYKLKHSYVKQPLAVISEMIDDKNKKRFKDWIAVEKAKQPNASWIPDNPETVRQLIDAVVNISDVVLTSPHAAYAAWVLKEYLANHIPINIGQPNPDENNIKQALTIFDNLRKTKTEIPIKQWANPEDQWNLKFYSVGDLRSLENKVNSGEVSVNTEADSNELEFDKIMNSSESEEEKDARVAVYLKKRSIDRGKKLYSSVLYNEGGKEIIFIKGAPTVGEDVQAQRYAAYAWYDLANSGNGTKWCVGFPPWDSNPHGPRYLKDSDVLVYRENGNPLFSLQYEGHLRIRDIEDNEPLENSLKEMPLGEFTLIVIDETVLNSLPASTKALKNFVDIYPSLNLSESKTFGNKQLVIVPFEDSGKNDDAVAKSIHQKIMDLGYHSIKDYVLTIYPTILTSYWVKKLAGFWSDEQKKAEIPGLSEYCDPTILQTLAKTTGDAEYKYLLFLIFRYREVIENNILEKGAPNLAVAYIKTLSDIVAKHPEVSKAKEFSDFAFFISSNNDEDY